MTDATILRKVLSAYPTGVCVVAAQGDDGRKHAMVVGSFTSISLDPPLIGFYPAKSSASWPEMAAIGRFTVSVLGSHQLQLCQQFAIKGVDKFGSLAHQVSPAGHPVIEEAVAWFDCKTEAVHEIGDHFLVVGRIEALDGDPEGDPLLFFGGKYHGIGTHFKHDAEKNAGQS